MKAEKHDLSLPAWGPYTKEYLGVSHVADREKGLRFDLCLFPGYYRRSVMVPRDIADCGAKIFAAATDLSRFCYRYELEWKDRVYLDADFCSSGAEMVATLDFHNDTDFPESLTLNAVARLCGCSQYHRDLRAYRAVLPEECRITDAGDYVDLDAKIGIPSDGLRAYEGYIDCFCGAVGVRKFGKPGDQLMYEIPATLTDAVGIRYRGGGAIRLCTAAGETRIELTDEKDIAFRVFSLEEQMVSSFAILSDGGEVDLDGFVFGKSVAETAFVPVFSDCHPEMTVREDGMTVFFGNLAYNIAVEGAEIFPRRLIGDDIGTLLTEQIHNHVGTTLRGAGDKEAIDLFLRPIFVDARATRRVVIRLNAPRDDGFRGSGKLYEPAVNPSGERFLFSRRMMSAVTLTNVVFPIPCRGEYIRHNTPGRFWDSLYTWDSGFIGLGLATMDITRATECLRAYMTDPGDKDSPYIQHGSTVPTQIFLFADLVRRTGDRDFAAEYYPLVRRQYDFYARGREGIFNLWNIFYNSGGWDDYPPQKYVHDHKLENSVSPVINTAMTVLCARILLPFAEKYDSAENTALLREDIRRFSEAIERDSWDGESGYYGYVLKDGGILENMGVNANMGMDGVEPYIAGIARGERAEKCLANIREGMMTPIGVSVVDTRAPYFSKSGYWNGSVWMPHQWILWKALLDRGEWEFAGEIAMTALALFERETSHTYNCYEHFMIENRRGAGFHQFSGLSTPVLLWHETYFTPFTVTGGFGTLITDRKKNGKDFSFRVKTDMGGSVLVCLPEDRYYEVRAAAKMDRPARGLTVLTYAGAGEDEVTFSEKETEQ